MTVVDAGSSGADTFPGFRRYVIDQAPTRILAFLNISAMGIIDADIGELIDIQWLNVERAVAVCRANPATIIGIKVRLSQILVGENGAAALERALQVGEEVSLPIMVHVGGTDRPLGEILKRMRAGDILTHCFTGWAPTIIGADRRVIPEAMEARERGVLFDVGHGAGSFSFEIAQSAIEQGFLPDTISTDLHTQNVDGPVFDLVTTLTKFLYLGLSIDEVIARATTTPARALRSTNVFGALKPGMTADVVLLRIEEGRFTLTDCAGVSRASSQRIAATATVHAGRLVEAAQPAPA